MGETLLAGTMDAGDEGSDPESTVYNGSTSLAEVRVGVDGAGILGTAGGCMLRDFLLAAGVEGPGEGGTADGARLEELVPAVKVRTGGEGGGILVVWDSCAVTGLLRLLPALGGEGSSSSRNSGVAFSLTGAVTLPLTARFVCDVGVLKWTAACGAEGVGAVCAVAEMDGEVLLSDEWLLPKSWWWWCLRQCFDQHSSANSRLKKGRMEPS